MATFASYYLDQLFTPRIQRLPSTQRVRALQREWEAARRLGAPAATPNHQQHPPAPPSSPQAAPDTEPESPPPPKRRRSRRK